MVMGRVFKILIVVNSVILFFLIIWTLTGKVQAIDSKSVVGIWECRNFPKELSVKLGLKRHIDSKLEINSDGSFSVSNFPVRSPYKLIPIHSGSWEILSGEMTPSGNDSIYIDGYFLTGSKRNGVKCLVYVISGKDDLKLFYFKSEK
jgi:hypothetical protein